MDALTALGRSDDEPFALPPGFTGYAAPAAPLAAPRVFQPQFLDGLHAALTAPRDAWTGDLQVMGPDGHPTVEAMDRASGLAGLAMTGGLGGAAVRQGETVLGAGPIRAYHGSPHDFDKFSLSAIGSGEGAQAYGHGLYFADNEAVARSYRDALSGKPKVYLDDRPFTGSTAQPRTPEEFAATVTSAAGGDHALARSHLEQLLGYMPDQATQIEGARGLLDSGRIDFRSSPGHMYEVAIDADPTKMLNFDAPFAVQPRQVQDIGSDFLSKLQTQGYMRNRSLGDMNGQDVMWMLRKAGQSPAETATTLRDAGVPGVRYLDAASRFGADKTSNTVTFSDDIVSILRKYGLAGLGALGAGAGMLGQPGDAQAAEPR